MCANSYHARGVAHHLTREVRRYIAVTTLFLSSVSPYDPLAVPLFQIHCCMSASRQPRRDGANWPLVSAHVAYVVNVPISTFTYLPIGPALC